MKIALLSIFPDIQSYGIRTISACLKKEGHDVDLIFLQKNFKTYAEKTLNDLVELIKGSDLVGITLMTNFWDSAIQITEKIKKNCNMPVVWGGIHPTIRPDECLDHADMVCIGEGEEIFVELIRKMEKGQNYHDIKGMGFRVNGKKINNGQGSLPGTEASMFKSLDQVPFQDYDYESHFMLEGENIVKMNLERITQTRLLEFYQTQPTRGCPFACTFCINNTYLKMYPHQKPIRIRSVDNIIRELQEVKRNLPFVKIMLFEDDAFFLMKLERIKELGRKYKELIRMPLVVTGVTPSTITKEKLAVLVDAGLVGMRMGIQSAAEKTKKLYKRPNSNLQVEKAVKIINEYRGHIKVFYDIILDSPWDTDDNLQETLMFLSKLPTPYQLSLLSLIFFPGTDIYRHAKRDGLIKDDVKDVYRKHFSGVKKTYLNDLFFILGDYALVGVGVSPIIMFFLTHKMTRKLRLHWISIKILKALFPFFRTCGRKVRKSTQRYKTGWDSVTKKSDYYEKIIENELATRPRRLLPGYTGHTQQEI